MSKFFLSTHKNKMQEQDSNPQPSVQQDMMLTTTPEGMDEKSAKNVGSISLSLSLSFSLSLTGKLQAVSFQNLKRARACTTGRGVSRREKKRARYFVCIHACLICVKGEF